MGTRIVPTFQERRYLGRKLVYSLRFFTDLDSFLSKQYKLVFGTHLRHLHDQLL